MTQTTSTPSDSSQSPIDPANGGPQSLRRIRELLDARGIRPSKALGQNFLIDANLVRRLVEASGVGPGDTVLEVGPGTGTLTAELLARGCRVVAVELDDELCDLLLETLGLEHPDRLALIRGDALASKRELNPDAARALGDGPFRLVANLPYQAATPLILTLLADHPRCAGLFVTIQREVADRLTAGPGDGAYGAISVVAGCTARSKRLAVLPPECFWPRPGVTSAMIGLTRLQSPVTPDPRGVAEFCRVLFASRRKQIGPTLRRMGVTEWPGWLDPTRRPENLTPEQLAELASRWPLANRPILG